MANSPVMVKEPAGQHTSDLLKACEDNFSRLYPECLNSSDHGTIMCPAAFPFGYVAPRGEASGAIRTKRIEEDAFTGDAAELKIFDVLETSGGKMKQPMFVLPKLKFNDFAEQVLRKMLPDKHPTLVKFLQRERQGEVDFVIVHRRIGVILIEVKSLQKFRKGEYCTAKKQLNSGEEIIQAVIHGIGIPNIPVHKVIAMPNLSDPGFTTSGFTNLREINVGSHDDFQRWWTTHFEEEEFGSSEQEGIQKLIAILVGQRSAVSCPAKVLWNVFNKIDTQSFLERSFDKRDTVKGPDVVKKTANEQELRILAKQFMFLNPEQQRIWNGPRRQFFCGVYGSGKTILIQFKALECAQNGEKVVVMVPPQLTHLYNDFFEVNGVSSKVNVVSYIYEVNDIFLRSDSVEFHFFADEWQLFLLHAREWPGFLVWFRNAVIGTCSYYCWIAYDDKQCISLPLELVLVKSVQDYIQNFLDNGAFYHAASLTTNMRSTVQVYSHWKNTLKGEECRLKVLHESAANFPLDRYWLYPVYLGHHICGPSVIEMPVPTNSLKGMIQVIKQEIESWAKDGEVYTFNKVAVLVVSELQWLRKALDDEMSKEHIPVCERGDKCNGVVLEFGNLSHSYEWPVVIAICTRNTQEKSLVFSRTVTRLVVLYADPRYFIVPG